MRDCTSSGALVHGKTGSKAPVITPGPPVPVPRASAAPPSTCLTKPSNQPIRAADIVKITQKILLTGAAYALPTLPVRHFKISCLRPGCGQDRRRSGTDHAAVQGAITPPSSHGFVFCEIEASPAPAGNPGPAVSVRLESLARQQKFGRSCGARAEEMVQRATVGACRVRRGKNGQDGEPRIGIWS